jgi:D-sedoheptulose 7-phosphate isomerase
MSFSVTYLEEVQKVASSLNAENIEIVARILADTRAAGGRLFILGVGGSAANASHAVNDFRKIAGIEAYAPTDNVSELTARTNDEGWATVFEAWLKGSHLRPADTLLILSVGGGNAENNVSPNLVAAVDLAKSIGSHVVGIVGRDGGYTAKKADACVIIPTVNSDHVTPHSEAFQAVVWHLLVSHPLLKQTQTKWESLPSRAAVFLDRDGTLTEEHFPPESLDGLKISPDALVSLTSLKEAGFKLVLVTNQPDIGRGKLSTEAVNEVNSILAEKLPLDRVYVCPHSDEHNCDCRKPKIGMFERAAVELGIDLKRSYMVGDTWRDTSAGVAAGCKVVWLRNDSPPGKHCLGGMPDTVVVSLTDAASWILEDSK